MNVYRKVMHRYFTSFCIFRLKYLTVSLFRCIFASLMKREQMCFGCCCCAKCYELTIRICIEVTGVTAPLSQCAACGREAQYIILCCEGSEAYELSTCSASVGYACRA